VTSRCERGFACKEAALEEVDSPALPSVNPAVATNANAIFLNSFLIMVTFLFN